MPAEPGSLGNLPRAAETLRLDGRDDEALELMAAHLLAPHPPTDLETGRALSRTLRLLRPPPFDNAPIVLGAIFVAVGGAGTVAGVSAFIVDSAFSSYEPLPYILLFTAAGASILGGLLALTFGLIGRDTGAVGDYRSTSHRLHRALREDAHRARAAQAGQRRAR